MKQNSPKIPFSLRKWFETLVDRALVRYKLAFYLHRKDSSVNQLVPVLHVAFLLIRTALLMSRACKHTSCVPNLSSVIIQEITK